MVETKMNESAAAPKEIKRLDQGFGLTFVMLKDSLSKGLNIL